MRCHCLAVWITIVAPLSAVTGHGSEQLPTTSGVVELLPARDSEASFFSGRATLSTTRLKSPGGVTIELDVTFQCTSGWGKVRNPFFDPGLPSPAWVSVFSNDGKHISDIVAAGAPVQRQSPTTIMMRCGDIAGRRFSLVPTSKQNDDARQLRSDCDRELLDRELILSPGKYQVQACYSIGFLSDAACDSHEKERRQPVASRRESDIFCRSNIVDIEIVDTASIPLWPEDVSDLSKASKTPTPIGAASLRLDREKTEVGNIVGAEMRFTNLSNRSHHVYDPFVTLRQSTDYPACGLELLDTHGKCLGDLFASSGGSSGVERAAMWATLPAGGICGTRACFRAGHTAADGYHRILPSGTYSIQVVYFDRFISPCPVQDVDDDVGVERPLVDRQNWLGLKSWKAAYPGNEILRSNLQNLEISSRN